LQKSKDFPADRPIGNQVGLYEYPDLNAIILQLSFRFGD
jgi:hypothetical protein